MFKTGSKFLFALAGFGFLLAFAWAGATAGHGVGMDSIVGPLTLGYKGYVGQHTGFAVLAGMSAAALFLGIFLAAVREADPEAVAQVAGLETVPAHDAPDTLNYWPVVAAFSLAAIALGLAIGATMVVIGLVGLTVTVVEWSVRAWSDRATGDAEVNRTIRDRFMQPVEIPATALLAIGGLVLAISRILLALPKIGSYLVFGLVPVLVFLVGLLITKKSEISHSVIAALLLVGGLALLVGGVAAAIHGEREHEGEHEEETHEGEEGLAPLPAPSSTLIKVGTRA